MTVATYEPAPPSNSVTRWVSILAPAAELAERIANTEFVPAAMRGNAAVVTAAIMYGDEIGLGPMQALASINVIDGRPSPSSELMRALIYRAGHDMGVEFLSGSRCVVWGRRAGSNEPPTRVEWTIQNARDAGLAGKAVWNRYPRAMLLARASSELARDLFPDAIKGLGHFADDATTAEDFATWAHAVPVAEDEPAKTTVRRRRTQTRSLPPSDAPQTAEQGDAGMPTPEPRPEPVWPQEDAPRTPDPMPEPEPMPDPWDGADPWAEPSPPAKSTNPVDIPRAEEPQPVGDAKASQRLKNAIFAALGEIGAANNDELRHAIATAILKRPVESFDSITRREGLKMVGALSDLSQGVTLLKIADDGTVTIHAREIED